MDHPASPQLERFPTWRLSQASARSHRVLHEHLAQAGASAYEFRVLAALGDLGQPSQAELGRAAALDRRDVTHTARGLESRHLVRRRADPRDARQKLIELTGAGRSMLERLESIVEDVQSEVFAPLTATQRQTFLDLLQRLS